MQRIPLVAVYFLFFVVIFAHPSPHRTAADIKFVAFANLLEQLESAFYTQALEKFNSSDFETAGFASSQIPIQQLEMIASDESVHVMTLESAIHALGGEAVSNCTFDFSSALADVNMMIATARVVENVCVSAYLGVLTHLADPALVAAAGSIMTVEARHQTILNLLSNATSVPEPFDVALTPADVLAIANTFISRCSLGFSANPPLTVTYDGILQAGMPLNFSSPALNGAIDTKQLSCHIMAGGTNASHDQPMADCMVPVNVTGPMYVFITNDQMATPPHGMNGTTNSTITVAGPALLFIDKPDYIGKLIRPDVNPSSATIPGNVTMSSTTPTVTAMPSLPPSTSNATSPVTPAAPALPTTSTAPTSFPTVDAFTTIISPAQASDILSSLIGSINSSSL